MESKEVSFQQHISEFPDRVLSYIFSKLSVKDLVKTSTLSKQWLHKYHGLRADLNFDLQNVFENTSLVLPKGLPLFKEVQSQFAERVYQLMLHYEGSLIRSLRVNFPLDDEQSDVIGRLISQGISKGVERIELLFSFKTSSNFHDFMLELKPYEFSFTLLSDTDTLKYLHLENCLISATLKFSRFKNLRTLALHLVVVEQDMLSSLLSNSINLEELTLDECAFQIELNITSPTLCHLNILNYRNDRRRIDIIAPNLSSFEYSTTRCEITHPMNIMTNKLSKFRYKSSNISEVVGFYVLKNVTTIVLHGITEWLDHIAPVLFSECLQLEDVTFKHCTIMFEVKIISPMLRHLNIIDCGSQYWRDQEIYIDASNLSSFDYSGPMTMSYIDAPNLLKVFWNATKKGRSPWPFDMIASSDVLESLAMIISDSKIAILPKVWDPFRNLRQLEFFFEGAYDSQTDYFWILDIATVSPCLQNLSLTIRNSHLNNSDMITLQRRRREYMGVFHISLKYVELHGCVGTINVIELASHLLRNVNSVTQITFSSRDKFYLGAGRWTESSGSCGCFDRNLIREMLSDEINEECQLIIL